MNTRVYLRQLIAVSLGLILFGGLIILVSYFWQRSSLFYNPSEKLVDSFDVIPLSPFCRFSIDPESGEILGVSHYKSGGGITSVGCLSVIARPEINAALEVKFRTKRIDHAEDGCSALCHSPDGSVVALAPVRSGSERRSSVVLLDSASLAPLQQWEAHQYEIRSLVYDASGRYLASQSDTAVKIWGVDDQQLLVSVDIPTDMETRSDLVAFENGFAAVYFTVSSEEAGVYKIGADDGDLSRVSTLRSVRRPRRRAALSRDGHIVAALFEDSDEAPELHICDAASGALLFRLDGRDLGRSGGLVLSPSAHLVAVSFWDRSISIWDLRTRKLVVTVRGFHSGPPNLFLVDDRTLIASDVHNLTIWDLTRPR